jgi:hypothetical protein
MNPDIRVGGSWHSITRGDIFLGGSWRTLSRGEIYKGGDWHALFNFILPLTVAITPKPVVKNGRFSPVVSGNVTATPTGGAAPFTYAWSVTGGISATSPTNAVTTMSASLADGDTASGTATLTVTDSLGTTATDSTPVTLTNIGPIDIGGHQ